MAIKSRAQRRKFAQLLVEGKIKPSVYERWNRGAGKKELPEHVAKKRKGKSKKKKSRKTKRGTHDQARAGGGGVVLGDQRRPWREDFALPWRRR